MTERILTQKLAQECFDYLPETGVLRWKVRPLEHFASESVWKASNKKCAGKDAGGVEIKGYRTVRAFGIFYKAHRVAWLMMTGEFPANQIDHIDGCRVNNRWDNLRSADSATNSKNQSMYRNNTSGTSGVFWCSDKQKWQAQIRVNGKARHLGFFTDKSEAIESRKAAEVKYGFHKNHGRQKPIPGQD